MIVTPAPRAKVENDKSRAPAQSQAHHRLRLIVLGPQQSPVLTVMLILWPFHSRARRFPIRHVLTRQPQPTRTRGRGTVRMAKEAEMLLRHNWDESNPAACYVRGKSNQLMSYHPGIRRVNPDSPRKTSARELPEWTRTRTFHTERCDMFALSGRLRRG